MKIEIDQSGRIEYTSKPTVLAFTNKINFSVIMLPKDKKSLQKLFRKAGTPNIFVYKTFAVLVFYLIRNHLRAVDQIIIDREYIGYEKLIKQFIIELCEKHKIKLDPEIIHFKSIGKKSIAHKIAIEAYRKKRAKEKFTISDFLKITL